MTIHAFCEKVFDERLPIIGVIGKGSQKYEDLVGGYKTVFSPHVETQFRFPARIDIGRAVDLLEYWPAWQITKLAELELGSGVLVMGNGWLARTIVALCTVRGCLWHKWVTTEANDTAADYCISSEHIEPEKLLRLMPARPDAVIVLDTGDAMLSHAFAICKDRGTIIIADPAPASVPLNLYPDVHRRGLTMKGFSWFTFTEGDEWEKAIVLLNRLFDKGLLTTTNLVLSTNA